jgi:hypothetical protein
MTMRTLSTAVALMLVSHVSWAQDKKKPAPKLKLDLGVKEGALPVGEKLVRPTEKAPETTRGAGATAESNYALLSVTHGKRFTKDPSGAKSAEPFAFLKVYAPAGTCEAFSTVVRVRSKERRSGAIEVAVLDPRGETVMEAKGQIAFRNVEEAEWQVDWDPTPMRLEGEYLVSIRVAGNPLGTAPLKVTKVAESAP